MDPKKHLQVVFAFTSILLIIAIPIYLSGCKPPFIVGLCSAVRLTRVATLVLTTLNFLLISLFVYELKFKKFKKSETTSLLATYLVLIFISAALALFELKVLTRIRFSNNNGNYPFSTPLR